MVNILTQLKTMSDLSPNEKVAADYILDHPGQVLTMSSAQLAEECLVSVSTIYRLCDKLGLQGFSQLKLRIANVYTEYLNQKQGFDYNFPVQNNQTPFEIMGRLKEDYKLTIEDTYNLFNIQQVTMIARAMKKAKQIDIYTSAGNVYFAQNFMFQMAEISAPVRMETDEYFQRLLAASSDKNHIAVIISFGGRGYLANIIPKILQQTGCPMILISSKEYQPDYVPKYRLYFSSGEHHSNKISSFATRLSLLYVLDVLYTCFFELDYELNIEKKRAYYHLLTGGKAQEDKK